MSSGRAWCTKGARPETPLVRRSCEPSSCGRPADACRANACSAAAPVGKAGRGEAGRDAKRDACRRPDGDPGRLRCCSSAAGRSLLGAAAAAGACRGSAEACAAGGPE